MTQELPAPRPRDWPFSPASTLRIDPLAMLGLRPGDAKILRNAGARVTPDSLRSLVIAANLLGVTRACVVQHTDCAMVGCTDEQMASAIEAASVPVPS